MNTTFKRAYWTALCMFMYSAIVMHKNTHDFFEQLLLAIIFSGFVFITVLVWHEQETK